MVKYWFVAPRDMGSNPVSSVFIYIYMWEEEWLSGLKRCFAKALSYRIRGFESHLLCRGRSSIWESVCFAYRRLWVQVLSAPY